MAQQLGNNYYNSPFKFNGKELDEETGFYYYGARYYDPRISIWLSVDPLAEKFPNWNPYTYCLNNPLNVIDPDGRDIIFLTRNNNGSIKEQFTYRNGNFYRENNKRYNPGKEGVSKTMYKVLTAYRAIEKSNDKILKNQLHTLEKSDQKHYVEQSLYGENAVSSLRDDLSYLGKPAGTQTEFDFDVNYEGEKSDLGVVTHEMRHQYDNDIGNMKDKVPGNSASDPEEIRATFNENRGRKLEGKSPVTKYRGVEIDPKKLAYPPNNKQSKNDN